MISQNNNTLSFSINSKGYWSLCSRSSSNRIFELFISSHWNLFPFCFPCVTAAGLSCSSTLILVFKTCKSPVVLCCFAFKSKGRVTWTSFSSYELNIWCSQAARLTTACPCGNSALPSSLPLEFCCSLIHLGTILVFPESSFLGWNR